MGFPCRTQLVLIMPGNPFRMEQQQAKTGKQPVPAPGGQQGSSQNTATPQANSPCLISFPKSNLAVFSVGGGCLLSKTNVRAMAGGLIFGASGFVVIAGAVILVAAGFKRSGALNRVATAASVVPGGQAVAKGLRTAGRVM